MPLKRPVCHMHFLPSPVCYRLERVIFGDREEHPVDRRQRMKFSAIHMKMKLRPVIGPSFVMRGARGVEKQI